MQPGQANQGQTTHVLVFGGARIDNSAVCEHHPGTDKIVDGETVLATEIAKPTTQNQSLSSRQRCIYRLDGNTFLESPKTNKGRTLPLRSGRRQRERSSLPNIHILTWLTVPPTVARPYGTFASFTLPHNAPPHILTTLASASTQTLFM